MFVVDDQADPVVWSIARVDDETNPNDASPDDANPNDTAPVLRATRGRVTPAAAEIRASFTVMLQLLAGAIRLDDARARSRATTEGDAALVAAVTPYLPEGVQVIPPVEDPASAS